MSASAVRDEGWARTSPTVARVSVQIVENEVFLASHSAQEALKRISMRVYAPEHLPPPGDVDVICCDGRGSRTLQDIAQCLQ